MVSEWEELEKLSKDELIIELMKERYAHRDINSRLRMIIDYDHKAAKELPCEVDDGCSEAPGYRTTEAWARKIIEYARSKSDDPEFDYTCVFDYGLNWDQASDIFDKMAEEGLIDWASDDPRSRKFSGVPGLYMDEVEGIESEESEKKVREHKEESV